MAPRPPLVRDVLFFPILALSGLFLFATVAVVLILSDHIVGNGQLLGSRGSRAARAVLRPIWSASSYCRPPNEQVSVQEIGRVEPIPAKVPSQHPTH
jgi:hypothetical protein